MSLHPKLVEFLQQIQKASKKPFESMSIEEMRQATKNFSIFQGEPEVIHDAFTKTIKLQDHEYAVRIYRPFSEFPLPVVLYFHAGGFVKGDIAYSESFCRKLANGSGCIIISVNYRLAPEHPFPAALDDAYYALEWVHQSAREFGGDPDTLAVVGESSGGNLAAAISLMSYMKKGPSIKLQILLYPQLDYTHSCLSHSLFADGYFLTEQALYFYAKQYLPEAVDLKDPYLSPYWTKHHKYLPHTYIITAEYDPLRDEAENYAKELKKAGVKVVHHRYPGMIHGFISMVTLLEEATQAIQSICRALQIALQDKSYENKR